MRATVLVGWLRRVRKRGWGGNDRGFPPPLPVCPPHRPAYRVGAVVVKDPVCDCECACECGDGRRGRNSEGWTQPSQQYAGCKKAMKRGRQGRTQKENLLAPPPTLEPVLCCLEGARRGSARGRSVFACTRDGRVWGCHPRVCEGGELGGGVCALNPHLMPPCSTHKLFSGWDVPNGQTPEMMVDALVVAALMRVCILFFLCWWWWGCVGRTGGGAAGGQDVHASEGAAKTGKRSRNKLTRPTQKSYHASPAGIVYSGSWDGIIVPLPYSWNIASNCVKREGREGGGREGGACEVGRAAS